MVQSDHSLSTRVKHGQGKEKHIHFIYKNVLLLEFLFKTQHPDCWLVSKLNCKINLVLKVTPTNQKWALHQCLCCIHSTAQNVRLPLSHSAWTPNVGTSLNPTYTEPKREPDNTELHAFDLRHFFSQVMTSHLAEETRVPDKSHRLTQSQ